MRIALFTDGIWPDVIGGMQKHSFYLARYLAIKGIDVDLYYCTASADDPVPSYFSSEEKQKLRFIKVDFPQLSLKMPGHYVLESYRYSRALYEAMLKQDKPDFIYAQGFTAWHALSEKTFMPPVGVNLHGVEMYQYTEGWKQKLQQYLLRVPARICLQGADLVFSLGGKLTGIQAAIAGRAKIVETPIGIGSEWLNENPSELSVKRKFLFTGRNERRKGIEELFAALRLLHQQGIHNFECHFIGPLPEQKLPGCRFYGEMKDAAGIRHVMQSCDVLLCPSLSEGMPTVILEAMASGLAVIASDVGAVSRQVDSSNGILVAPGDKTALAEAIKSMITMPAGQLQKYKSESVSRVRSRFLWDAVADITIEAIRAQS